MLFSKFRTSKIQPMLIAVFFIFVFFFSYFANTQISWYTQQSVFYCSSAFITGHFAYPSGLSDLLASFISQFFYFRVIGALIITLLLFLIFIATASLFRKLPYYKTIGFLAILPSGLILFLLRDYNMPLTYFIQFFIAIIFCLLYLKVYNKKNYSRIIILALSVLLLYYVAALGAVILFCLLSIFFEFSKQNTKNTILVLLLNIALIIGISLISKPIFLLSTDATLWGHYAKDFANHNNIFLIALYLFIPLIFMPILFSKKELALDTYHKNNQTYTNNKLFSISLAVLILLVVFIPVDKQKQQINEVEYYAYKQNWDKILEICKKQPSDERLINYYTDLALYKTGRMTINLFDYPQTWGSHALFLTDFTEPTSLIQNSDLYYSLGHIGAAQYWAFEAQTIYENTPRILQRLIKTQIISGNYKAASSFINQLKKSWIHRDIAQYYERCIEDSAVLLADKEIQSKKALRPDINFFLNKREPVNEMFFLLEKNKLNRMAFEYMQTYLLFTHDVNKFVKNLHWMNDLEYKVLPVVYEEALAVYLFNNYDNIDGNYQGIKLSENTKARFKGYGSIMNYYNGNLEQARGSVEVNYKNTYWYYLNYSSPVKTKKEIKYLEGNE